MNIEFDGQIWVWKGPAPWYFITVPEPQNLDVKAVAGVVTYGWGMIPVKVRIGKTRWSTSMWPKDDSYVVPIKAAVRKAEKIEAGDTVTVHLEID